MIGTGFDASGLRLPGSHVYKNSGEYRGKETQPRNENVNRSEKRSKI